MGDVIEEDQRRQRSTRRTKSSSYLLEPRVGQAAASSRFAAACRSRTRRTRGSTCSSAAPARIPKGEMGCTICHDGQGSATDFKWASHTPNDPDQADRVGPPVRLVRQPSLDFPDDARAVRREQLPQVPSRSGRARAERAVPRSARAEAGRRLSSWSASTAATAATRSTASTVPNKRIGPDLRVEPNYNDVAAQILQDPGLTDEQRAMGDDARPLAGQRRRPARSCCARSTKTPRREEREAQAAKRTRWPTA